MLVFPNDNQCPGPPPLGPINVDDTCLVPLAQRTKLQATIATRATKNKSRRQRLVDMAPKKQINVLGLGSVAAVGFKLYGAHTYVYLSEISDRPAPWVRRWFLPPSQQTRLKMLIHSLVLKKRSRKQMRCVHALGAAVTQKRWPGSSASCQCA